MHIDLPIIWAFIIGLGVFIYVLLDGFDLGIGLLFPFFEDKQERQVMINTIAPVWDGNETFLVLGGAGLYCAFPVVYSTLLPANYLPIILMLMGFIFRGAAFELRSKAIRTQHLWDLAFTCGSALATFCQGVILGSLLQGIQIADGHFVGGAFDWLSPFSLFCGFSLLVTYATLGCAWLIIKTAGKLQTKMYALMKPITLVMLATIGLISLWTILGQPAIAARWLDPHHIGYLLPVPVLVLAAVWGILRAIKQQQENRPFFLGMVLMFLGYTGFIISIWPNIIPPSLTIWEASSPHSSQLFGLFGIIIVLPLVLLYISMQYRVFRGKVHADDPSYH